MFVDLTPGIAAAITQHVPVPVLGAGLASGNVVPGGVGPTGAWLPLVLVLLLIVTTLPVDRVFASRRTVRKADVLLQEQARNKWPVI